MTIPSNETFTKKQLLEAIANDPDRLWKASVANPQLCELLKDIYPSLKNADTKQLNRAMDTLPPVPVSQQPSHTPEFKVYADLAAGKLEVMTPGISSSYEWRLTLKDVQPGKTQASLKALAVELNEKLTSLPNYPNDPKWPWRVRLDENEHDGFPQLEKAGNMVITGTSIINDSCRRARSETTTVGGQERTSQRDLLKELGLEEVERDIAAVVIGLFRLKKGFKEPGASLNAPDPGDLLEKLAARVKPRPKPKRYEEDIVITFGTGPGDCHWVKTEGPHWQAGIIGRKSVECVPSER